ncbi:hypothetical protein GOODEAATRI_011880 [Goodea atripinnis]|uniref:GMPS ATP-PPase domain-containing protein n=1 Tax=Goodea atripinnis TaxID=208336 RepID=A0ABV0NJH6_9TELE
MAKPSNVLLFSYIKNWWYTLTITQLIHKHFLSSFDACVGLIRGLQKEELVLLTHGIANEQKKLYGTQFHPEVDLTERGMEMLRNFLFEIAGCTSNFTVHNRQQVLLSGGVDSTVCTALLNKALNQEQVIAVHIDNGFMRKRESQSVEEALTKLGIKLKGRERAPSSFVVSADIFVFGASI